MSLEERTRFEPNEWEAMSPDERRERKWRRLQQVVGAAWDGSREFKARMEGAGLAPGDVASPDDWPRIPVLRKKNLIELQQGGADLSALLTCQPGRLSRIYQSPGPIYDPEGRGPDYWGWTEAFRAAGFRTGDLVQMTFSYHLTPAGLMLEEPLREIGCAVVPAGPGNTEVQIDLLSSLPVTGFVGMASYLRIIADKARAKGVDIKSGLKLECAFVAAERLPEALRRGLERDLGIVVRQGYGTADLGCIAYECPSLGGMHVSNRCWVEICDPGTGQPLPLGQTGEVVVTPFGEDYPLIRFATGDLSFLSEDACDCGRTSLKLGGILGRVDDTAKVKGQFIYPSQAATVMRAWPQVRGWQIVVSNPGGRDTLTVRLALDGDLDAEALAADFQATMKLRPKIEILPSGKDIPKDVPRLDDQRVWDA